ncbi:Pathogenicity island protein, partial [Escherichia coli]
CILGTGGGAVTGGGTLGLAGAAVGTVTIPGIGTVGAGAVGAITGAVGGAMTGAAASCF